MFLLKYTVKEVLQYAEENDVKFVKLMFFDIFGNAKNISIFADELPRVFKNGYTFNASAIDGFPEIDSDLVLVPDPSTLAVLPWRPQHGRVVRLYCDIRHQNGEPFISDVRSILKKSVKKAISLGFTCNIGLECEFYLFKTDDDGNPTKIPYDNAGYLDIAPLDKGENVRRQICFTLEQMDMVPQSSHHERGPGQNEIDFMYSTPLLSADNFSTFKATVKTIAASNGLFASFMPKPLKDKSGNSMHINVMIEKYGYNIFKKRDGELSSAAKSFIAGVLRRAAEITAFLNPIVNSYERFSANEAPAIVSWSFGNCSNLVRILDADSDSARLQIVSPDTACNPYLAFALILEAGLEGVEDNLELQTPISLAYSNTSENTADGKIPSSLSQALTAAKQSEFVSTVIPEKFLESYYRIKSDIVSLYEQGEEARKAQDDKYFEII